MGFFLLLEYLEGVLRVLANELGSKFCSLLFVGLALGLCRGSCKRGGLLNGSRLDDWSWLSSGRIGLNSIKSGLDGVLIVAS